MEGLPTELLTGAPSLALLVYMVIALSKKMDALSASVQALRDAIVRIEARMDAEDHEREPTHPIKLPERSNRKDR